MAKPSDEKATVRAEKSGRAKIWLAAPAVVLLAGLVWAYWTPLGKMLRKWSDDPHYSHGYLVPLFALFLLWTRKERIVGHGQLKPNFWALAFLAVGVGVRFAGVYLYNDWLEGISLLPCLAGVTLLAGGWRMLGWAWPAILFLGFMVPLPFQVERGLGWPLQRIATEASTYTLQTLGFAALAEGNVIHMFHGDVGVVEACSGMGMLLLFFAVSTAVALLIQRPLYEKILIVLSAVPIALIANTTRIVVTGVLHETVGERVANLVFHDLAGWLMMPVALALLGVELWYLGRAVRVYEESRDHPAADMVGAMLATGPSLRGADTRRQGGKEKPV